MLGIKSYLKNLLNIWAEHEFKVSYNLKIIIIQSYIDNSKSPEHFHAKAIHMHELTAC